MYQDGVVRKHEWSTVEVSAGENKFECRQRVNLGERKAGVSVRICDTRPRVCPRCAIVLLFAVCANVCNPTSIREFSRTTITNFRCSFLSATEPESGKKKFE